MAQTIGCLPRKCEIPSSNASKHAPKETKNNHGNKFISEAGKA
jgi:hypothetical protein